LLRGTLIAQSARTMMQDLPLVDLFALNRHAASCARTALLATAAMGDRLQLERFHSVHQRYGQELEQLRRAYRNGWRTSWPPPPLAKSEREGASLGGRGPELRRLQRSEVALARAYAQALTTELPAGARCVIERQAREQLGHLRWLEQRLLPRGLVVV
jgi:hypothetical protein